MYPKIDSFIKFGNPTGITGKRDGSTNSEVIFPDGLLSAGDIHDELYEDKAIKRVGRVDLGTLSWTYVAKYGNFLSSKILDVVPGSSSSAVPKIVIQLYKTTNTANIDIENKSTTLCRTGWYISSGVSITDYKYTSVQEFKQSLQGVYLYYELKDPITYTLDTPLDLSYKVDDFGTESILGANVSTINTTKFNGNIKYALNAADTIRNLQTNYVSTYENQGLDEERKANARKNIGVEGIVDKADKSGIYPDLVAGNLVDEKNTGSSQVIMRLRTSCGTDSIVDDGYAQIKRIKGNSIVWNQLCKLNSITATGNATCIRNQDGSYHLGNTSWANSIIKINIHSFVNRHTYLLKFITKNNTIFSHIKIAGILGVGTGGYTWWNINSPQIYNYTNVVNYYNDDATIYLALSSSTPSCDLISFEFIDFTQMFGPGNEPSTVEEFDTLFPHIKYELSKTKDT